MFKNTVPDMLKVGDLVMLSEENYQRVKEVKFHYSTNSYEVLFDEAPSIFVRKNFTLAVLVK